MTVHEVSKDFTTQQIRYNSDSAITCEGLLSLLFDAIQII
jgi:hypothetical protein